MFYWIWLNVDIKKIKIFKIVINHKNKHIIYDSARGLKSVDGIGILARKLKKKINILLDTVEYKLKRSKKNHLEFGQTISNLF